jgi:hypothetical protein
MRKPKPNGAWTQQGKEKPTAQDVLNYQRLARRYSVEALRLLAKMAANEEVDPDVRRKCCTDLMDRAWGKPRESVQIESNAGPRIVFNMVQPADLKDVVTIEANGVQAMLPATDSETKQ